MEFLSTGALDFPLPLNPPLTVYILVYIERGIKCQGKEGRCLSIDILVNSFSKKIKTVKHEPQCAK